MHGIPPEPTPANVLDLCYGDQTGTALECEVTPLELSLLKWGVKWVIGL
jgi:hypothetical protein